MPDEAKEEYRGKVRIYGKNMLAGPIFDSAEAQTIVMYSSDGRPTVLLARQVDDIWAMGTCRDPDWEAVKRQFGVP